MVGWLDDINNQIDEEERKKAAADATTSAPGSAPPAANWLDRFQEATEPPPGPGTWLDRTNRQMETEEPLRGALTANVAAHRDDLIARAGLPSDSTWWDDVMAGRGGHTGHPWADFWGNYFSGKYEDYPLGFQRRDLDDRPLGTKIKEGLKTDVRNALAVGKGMILAAPAAKAIGAARTLGPVLGRTLVGAQALGGGALGADYLYHSMFGEHAPYVRALAHMFGKGDGDGH